MNIATLEKLKTSAKKYYDTGNIESEQKRLIDLLYVFQLDVIDIDKKIHDKKGKELADLDVVVYLDGTVLIFGVKNEKRQHFPHLEQFVGMKKLAFEYIQELYGRKPTDYKFIYYDAKANYEEHQHVKNAKVEDDTMVLFKEDIDYFFKISNIESRLARNDFLCNLNMVYKGKTEDRQAITYIMDGIGVYMLFVNPKDLFDCVIIPRKRSRNSGLSVFQRSIDKDRLPNIADYIKNPIGGLAFPNAIILATDEKLVSTDESKDKWGIKSVRLKFPIDYGTLKLIDGQHRLLGYSQTETTTQETNFLPVLILEGLQDNKKAKIFLDINSKAKQVDPNLRLLINSEIDWPSTMRKQIRDKNIVNLLSKLLDDKILLEDEIFLGHASSDKKSKILTLTTAVAGIRTTRIDQNSKDPFSDMKNLIDKIKHSENQSFYLDNIGFRILSKIIHKCLDDKEKYLKDNGEENTIDPKEFTNDLIDKLDKLKNLSELGYGEGGAIKRANELMRALKKKFPKDFKYLEI